MSKWQFRYDPYCDVKEAKDRILWLRELTTDRTWTTTTSLWEHFLEAESEEDAMCQAVALVEKIYSVPQHPKVCIR
jgi:hypothetical protein